MIKEGDLKSTIASINPVMERKFIIVDSRFGTPNFKGVVRALRLFMSIYILCYPVIYIILSASVYLLLNRYNLTWVILLFIVIEGSRLIYYIVPNVFRSFLMLMVIGGVITVFCGFNFKRAKNTKLLNWLVWEAEHIHVINLPYSKSLIPRNWFNRDSVENLLSSLFGLSNAFFFYIKPELTFSIEVIYELTVLALLGVPDMMLSGIFTASGISFVPSFIQTNTDRVLIAIVCASVYSKLLLGVFNNFKFIQSTISVDGNYSSLATYIAGINAFSLMKFVDTVVIFDYGNAKLPDQEPRAWSYDAILELSDAEHAYVNDEKVSTEFVNNEIDKIERKVRSHIYRGFRYKELPFDFEELNVISDIEYMGLYEGIPSLILSRLNPLDINCILRCIYTQKDGIMMVIDEWGNVYYIPYTSGYTYDVKKNHQNGMTLIDYSGRSKVIPMLIVDDYASFKETFYSKSKLFGCKTCDGLDRKNVSQRNAL